MMLFLKVVGVETAIKSVSSSLKGLRFSFVERECETPFYIPVVMNECLLDLALTDNVMIWTRIKTIT